jgi:hypothetical protein
LPDPYGSLRGYWVSAHYGLAGWAANRELYQIIVTDEEHDMTPPPPGEDKYYHIIAFEDANGAKPQGVHSVRLAIHRKDKPTLKYTASLSGKTGYYPVGRYEAWGAIITREGKKHKEVKVCDFEPIEVTEDSPVRLVFKVRPTRVEAGERVVDSGVGSEKAGSGEGILYFGHVVNAVTGKPMEEVSVRIKRQTVKTDSSGRFEIRFRPRLTHDALEAFKEGYFPTKIVIGDLPRPKSGRVEVKPMLFPAAKLKIVPCIAGDAPAGYRLVAAAARIRPWVVIDHNESPIWSSTFSSMYGWLTDKGSISAPRLQMNQQHTFLVPAGVNFRLLLITKFESLCPPDIPQTMNLEQGETLDLGSCEFKCGIRIFLKVVNSLGEAVKGVAITKAFGDTYYFTQSVIQGRPEVHVTDEDGRTAFYVSPGCEQKFDVYRDVQTWDVLKTVPLKIGGREDEGKEFIVQL